MNTSYSGSGTKVLSLADEGEWRFWLSRAWHYDFYHTWTYHRLHLHEGIPLLFVFHEGRDFVGIPFIRRLIPGSSCSDLTSVYGYAGPFGSSPFARLDSLFVTRFKHAFLEFLRAEKIVSVFSGLNPFMDQDLLLAEIGGVKDNGQVVVVDLKGTLDEQQAHYRSRICHRIGQVRNKGWQVREGKSQAEIAAFCRIYTENMRRLDASSAYLFNETYVYEMLTSNEFDARLLVAEDKGGNIGCASIVVIRGGIIQAHLIGTSEAFRRDSPALLMTEEVTVVGRKAGASYFNLGGGFAFRKDTLFDWKRNFSPLTLQYKTWRYIFNPMLYEILVVRAGIAPADPIDFFPLYRAKISTHQYLLSNEKKSI